jgi:hypothetical protein
VSSLDREPIDNQKRYTIAGLIELRRQMLRFSRTSLSEIITCKSPYPFASFSRTNNARQFFYACKGCGIRLRPLAGDCCVFCSYG